MGLDIVTWQVLESPRRQTSEPVCESFHIGLTEMGRCIITPSNAISPKPNRKKKVIWVPAFIPLSLSASWLQMQWDPAAMGRHSCHRVLPTMTASSNYEVSESVEFSASRGPEWWDTNNRLSEKPRGSSFRVRLVTCKVWLNLPAVVSGVCGVCRCLGD